MVLVYDVTDEKTFHNIEVMTSRSRKFLFIKNPYKEPYYLNPYLLSRKKAQNQF